MAAAATVEVIEAEQIIANAVRNGALAEGEISTIADSSVGFGTVVATLPSGPIKSALQKLGRIRTMQQFPNLSEGQKAELDFALGQSWRLPTPEGPHAPRPGDPFYRPPPMSGASAAGAHDGSNIDDQLHETHGGGAEEKEAEEPAQQRPVSNNRKKWRNIGIVTGAAGAGIAGVMESINRYGGPNWQIKQIGDGRIQVTDDEGTTKIIDPKTGKIENVVQGLKTPLSSPLGPMGSYGAIKEYGKFRFPKYSRYNYARWADYTNEAARRTIGGQMNQPIAQPMRPTVVRAGATGSRVIPIRSSGLGGK
jgi:hypothetical protein